MLWRHLTSNIAEALEHFPVVIVTGARQVGKSTLAQSLGSPPANWAAAYVTLDDRLVLDAALEDPDGFLAANPPPLVIDEVQRAPDLFRAVKRLVDKEPGDVGRYLLTGSANLMRLPQIGETLAGRAAVLKLYPFSWAELAGAPPTGILSRAFETGDAVALVRGLAGGPAPVDRRTDAQRIIMAGLYPRPALMDSVSARERWFSSYRQTYIERDIGQLSTLEHLSDFNRMLALAASRTATLLNKASLSRDSGLAYATLNRYLNIMEVTYQVDLVPPYHANVSKRLIKTPKVYSADSGMAAHLIGVDEWGAAEAMGLAGRLAETWVAGELAKLTSVTDSRMRLYFWRTASGEEVDFLVVRGRQVVAIELKWTQTVSGRDLSGLRALRGHLGENLSLCILLHPGTEVIAVDARTVAIPVGVFFGVDR